MKALVWHGKKDVRVESVKDPIIEDPNDILLEVTATAICGSDIHIYNGFIPAMKSGDVLGHEFGGKVVEVGANVKRVKVGDRVIIPFVIACGNCLFCAEDHYSFCENSNPNGKMQSKLTHYPTAGLFGYSHQYGGFWGGQAQYVRVPHGDVGALVLPDSVSEDQALFLSDIFPTGYMAAENCAIKEGDTVAVWGCGPVGQFAIKSAFLQGAGTVIAIDRYEDRLDLARKSGAKGINYATQKVEDVVYQMTEGRGPHACIDAVGLEAHGYTLDAVFDDVAQKLMIEQDRTHALREMIGLCRNGGTISIPGVYTGFVDKFPLGIAFAKGLSFKMGQTHVQKYMPKLLELIQSKRIDPSFVISHRMPLAEAAAGYKLFADNREISTKIILDPKAA